LYWFDMEIVKMSVWVVYVIIKTGGFELFLLDFDEIMSVYGIIIIDY